MKRQSAKIMQIILETLKEGNKYTYSELERKVNTGYRTIILNCKILECFKAVKISIVKKHSTNENSYSNIGLLDKKK